MTQPSDGTGEPQPGRARCLVYAPYSFSGQGPAASCASILRFFPRDLSVELFLPRRRFRLSDELTVHEALPPVLRRLPWRYVRDRAQSALDKAFARALRTCDPERSVVYIWPGAPLWLIREARALGFPIVREMINSALATAKPILDRAYRSLGIPAAHGLTANMVADEIEELHEYDFVFASNPEVENSLSALGISSDKILPTSFGWNPSRFANSQPIAPLGHGVRVLFVGSIGVRKGVPQLLDAWADAEVDGELLLAGRVEPALAEVVNQHTRDHRVRLAGYVDDVGSLYLGSDVFVFPTLEEGGPQVTYEAAGSGLPVITTPMGAARLARNGHSGIVVPPADRGQLTAALRLLGTDSRLRHQLAEGARGAAAAFDYRIVGAKRGQELLDIALRRHRGVPADELG